MHSFDLSFFTFPPQKEAKLTSIDYLIVFSLCALNIILQTWTLQHPANIVFDEVYFGNFTNWYVLERYFQDIHPPLAKLIFAGFAKLAQYDGSVSFAHLAHSHYDSHYFFQLRLSNAIPASFCSPLIFLAARFTCFSTISSFAGAAVLSFDTSLLIEHRIIVTDGVLHFFSCLFLCIHAYSSSLPRRTFKWYIWTFISGCALGCACSCKNTAWGLIPYCAFVEWLRASQNGFSLDSAWETFKTGLIIGIPTISVFFFSFLVHFLLLDKTPFDPKNDPPDEIGQLLKDPSKVDYFLNAKRLTKPGILYQILRLILRMHNSNMHCTDFHISQSKPNNWPLLTGVRVKFFNQVNVRLYCMGNVYVYYSVFAGLILTLAGFRRKKWMLGIRYVVGWAVSYFPFFLVPRVMYLYHYHIPLLIGGLLIASAMDLWLSKRMRGMVAVILVGLAAQGLYLWSHQVYGSHPKPARFTIWNMNWLKGDSDFQAALKTHSGDGMSLPMGEDY